MKRAASAMLASTRSVPACRSMSRRSGERLLEAGGVAHDADVARSSSARSRATAGPRVSVWSARVSATRCSSTRVAARCRGRGRDVGGGAGGEHHRFEQRVGGQAIGAVHAGRGALRRRPTGLATRGAAARVGGDAAHVVVRRRRDRDRARAPDRCRPSGSARRRWGRRRGSARRWPRGIEKGAAARGDLGEDGAGDDVARRQLGARIDRRHEALAVARRPASRLRRAALRSPAAPGRARRRWRWDGTARTPRRRCMAPARAAMREAFAARVRRVGRHGVEAADAARRQHDRAGGKVLVDLFAGRRRCARGARPRRGRRRRSARRAS